MGREVLDVPEMSCNHCRATIEAAVGEVPGVRAVAVDLDGKHVTVDGDFSRADVVAAIVDAGYDVAGPA
jgi:copper chaperone